MWSFRRERGMALVLALSAVAIVIALLGGILMLTVSHLALSKTNTDYAGALNLAEAGINWEIQKISQDAAQADVTPTTQAMPGGTGTFTVHIAPVTGSTWTPPDDFWIYSTGTMDRVSRTVRVKAAHALGGEYALFGINNMNVKGNLTINGAAGANGSVSVSGNPDLNGNFWYCGDASGANGKIEQLVDENGCNVNTTPITEHFDTVNELATEQAHNFWGASGTQTVDFFQTHNNNSLAYAQNTTTGETQPVTFTSKGGSPKLDKDAFPGTGWIIVLPPGDYYFESLNLAAGDTLKIDSAGGAVNVWLGPEAGTGKDDQVNGNTLFTANDPDHFYIYEGSKRTLQMNGTTGFYGNIYAYNGPDKQGDYYGSVNLSGNTSIWGSVIGYDVTKATGNVTITLPSTGGPRVPSGYGFISWEEVNPA